MTAHEAGIIHTWTFDQREIWVDVYGREHWIEFMDQDYAESVLVFLIRNAPRFKRVWLQKEHRVKPADIPPYGHEEDEWARHWMLRTPLALALMRRLQVFADV